MVVEIFLSLIIILLIVLIFFLLKREKNTPLEIENTLNKIWKESGIDEKIGQINLQAREIKALHFSFEKMLTTPTQRGYFGEIGLEAILKDQLPPDMYGIREQISSGKKPDAFIRSSAGIICIDSKFPLENYLKMVDSEGKEKEEYKKQFLRDFKNHLDKIMVDYIRPEEGTAFFAFAFIPSESIWNFLASEFFDILREYAIKGVQVVSPLTISSKIEFIKAGIHAKKLSEEAEKVKKDLQKLSRIFNEIDENWRIFFEKHLKGLAGKAEDLDKSYRKLREEFEKINKME